MTEGSDGEASLLDAAGTIFGGARSDGVAPLAIGVAVSGGGDSMALLHLLHRTAPPGARLHAVTVDHGLRAESAGEAATVAGFCAGLGIPHETLHWQGRATTGNLMDQARRARLSLMADWAAGLGITDIALGHTADDQAEGFVMNLARAAGLDGLSGMRPLWLQHGVRWHRPLLQQTRDSLRAYLRGQGIGWIEDPSNDNDRFARVRTRKVLALLRPLGITTDSLGATIRNLAAAQSALVQVTEQAAVLARPIAGGLVMARDDLATLPAEIRRRLLISVILWMNGADYPPRAAQMDGLIHGLDQGRDATLAGVRFRTQAATILVTREGRAVEGPVAPGRIWDHRWQVTGPFRPDMRIAALGANGLRQCPDWRHLALPREALLVSPAVWHGETLLAAPLVQENPLWQAIIPQDLGKFILSH